MAWIFNPFSGTFDFYVIGSAPAPVVDGVLLTEAQDYLITEAGDTLAWE